MDSKKRIKSDAGLDNREPIKPLMHGENDLNELKADAYLAEEDFRAAREKKMKEYQDRAFRKKEEILEAALGKGIAPTDDDIRLMNIIDRVCDTWSGSTSDRIKAGEQLARMYGLLTDKTQITGSEHEAIVANLLGITDLTKGRN